MRAVILCLAVFVAGCGQSGPADKANGKAAAPTLTLAVTPLELTAKAALEKRVRDKRAAEALQKRVKSAMETYLIDPFSAQYRSLRSGRSGSVCGQVNGKNRFGAYVGFRDFVLGRDGKTIWMSGYSDGVESELYSGFAEAYVNVCATKSQVRRYKALTAPPEYDSEYDYGAATEATDAAAAAAEAGKRM